jgi:hypothetical protein
VGGSAPRRYKIRADLRQICARDLVRTSPLVRASKCGAKGDLIPIHPSIKEIGFNQTDRAGNQREPCRRLTAPAATCDSPLSRICRK